MGVELIKKKLNVDLLICNTLDFDTAYKTMEYNSNFFEICKNFYLNLRMFIYKKSNEVIELPI